MTLQANKKSLMDSLQYVVNAYWVNTDSTWAWMCKPQFTATVVVMSIESNVCSVFTSKMYLRATYIHMGLFPCYHLKAKDADTETCCFHMTSLPKCLWNEVYNVIESIIHSCKFTTPLSIYTPDQGLTQPTKLQAYCSPCSDYTSTSFGHAMLACFVHKFNKNLMWN